MPSRSSAAPLCAVCVLDPLTRNEETAITVWQGTALCRRHIEAWVDLNPIGFPALARPMADRMTAHIEWKECDG